MKKRRIIGLIILIIIGTILSYYLSIPNGRIIQGQEHQISENNIEFLYDLTYENLNGEIIYNHEIFNKTFELIDNGETFILINMFLFGTTKKPHYKNLTQELTTHLINKKQSSPEIKIYFITDDYNFINKPENKIFLNNLKQNNISVIFTPLNKNLKFPINLLREKLKLSKKILNHRKYIITNIDNQIITLITSGNPHDLSSANSNTGIVLKEKIYKEIYEIEKKDSELNINLTIPNETLLINPITIQYLADGGLINSLKEEIDKTNENNSIDIAMFYLSDKSVINKLTSASDRGTKINIILDTNDFFFAQKKFGIPNKPVAEILLKKSNNKINIRWYKSHGEQFHTKLVIIHSRENTTIFTGSSNLVDNNIKLFNFQSDIKIIAPNNSSITQEINSYFQKIWNNQNGIYTTDYNEYKNKSILKKLTYELEQFLRMFQ